MFYFYCWQHSVKRFRIVLNVYTTNVTNIQIKIIKIIISQKSILLSRFVSLLSRPGSLYVNYICPPRSGTNQFLWHPFQNCLSKQSSSLLKFYFHSAEVVKCNWNLLKTHFLGIPKETKNIFFLMRLSKYKLWLIPF